MVGLISICNVVLYAFNNLYNILYKMDDDFQQDSHDKEILTAVLNHVNSGDALPPGVKIIKVLDMAQEIKSLIENLKNDHPEDDSSMFGLEIKEEIGDMLPVEYALAELKDGRGVAALPTKIIYYKEGEDVMSAGDKFKWFIFNSVYTATEYLIQTRQIQETGNPFQ